jgi:hypothetical protein
VTVAAMTRPERIFTGLAVVAGLAAAAIAKALERGYCGGLTRSTEVPIVAGSVVVFLAVTIVLVSRNRDVHNERRTLRYQVEVVAAAAVIACIYAALAHVPLEMVPSCD